MSHSHSHRPFVRLLAPLILVLVAAPLHAQDWGWFGDTPIIDIDRDPTASRSQPIWAPLGVYDAANPYKDLVIDAAEATFVPFAHDPDDPDRCGPSQIEVRFQVRNEGSEPLRIPQGPDLIVIFTNDAEHPWATRLPVPVRDYVNTPSDERATWNTIRGEARIAPDVIDRGDFRWVTASVAPPEGAWTPLEVRARLAIRAMTADFHGAYLFVGREAPVTIPLQMDVPDYHVRRAVLTSVDGRPHEEARAFKARIDVGNNGPLVGGPMRISFEICREADGPTCSSILHAERTFDDDDIGMIPWVTDELTLRRTPDWTSTYSVVDVQVGCPVHGGFDHRLRDANPSNDRGRRSAPIEPVDPLDLLIEDSSGNGG